MDDLTNDAKFLLSSMYKIYLEKRKSGETKDDSRWFDDVESVHSKIMPEWQLPDVESTCIELLANNMIQGMPADSTIFEISLTNLAIAKMENQFKDKVDSALEFATKIKGLIPFI